MVPHVPIDRQTDELFKRQRDKETKKPRNKHSRAPRLVLRLRHDLKRIPGVATDSQVETDAWILALRLALPQTLCSGFVFS